MSKPIFKEKKPDKLKLQEVVEVFDAIAVAAKLESLAPNGIQKSEQSQQPLKQNDCLKPCLDSNLELGEEIGAGGMGKIWKIYDKELKQTFAIKMIRHDLADDPTTIERFEQEAKLVTELTHANIAASYGPRRDLRGNSYILMDFIDGESLSELMVREGKLTPERALDILRQICDALAHSHMKGIIHRDIKPSNIILSKTDSGADFVHVVDFGIAKSIYGDATLTAAMTKTEDVLGSPRYMSPEQFLGEPITAQSDIYSLGSVFFEMLTGAPPFTEKNPVKLILQHLNEAPDLTNVPSAYKDLLGYCLQKTTGNRPSTVEDLLQLVSTEHRSRHSPPPVIFFVLLGCGSMALITQNSYSLSQPLSGPGLALFSLAVWLALGNAVKNSLIQSKEFRQLEIVSLTLGIFAFFKFATGTLCRNFSDTDIFGHGALQALLFCATCVLLQRSPFYDRFMKIMMKVRPEHHLVGTRMLKGMTTFLYTLLPIVVALGLFTTLAGLLTLAFAYDINIWAGLCVLGIGVFYVFVGIAGAYYAGYVKELTDSAKEEKRRRSIKRNWSIYIAVNLLLDLTLFTAAWEPSFRSAIRNHQVKNISKQDLRVLMEASRYPITQVSAMVRISAAEKLLYNIAPENQSDAISLLTPIYDNQRLSASTRAIASTLMASAYVQQENWAKATYFFDIAIRAFRQPFSSKITSRTEVIIPFLWHSNRAGCLNQLLDMAVKEHDVERQLAVEQLLTKGFTKSQKHRLSNTKWQI